MILLPFSDYTTQRMSKAATKRLGLKKPDLLLSAHVHRGVALSAKWTSSARKSARGGDYQGSLVNTTQYFEPGQRDASVKANVTEDRAKEQIREIVVPTCSYRMGEKKMALGMLAIYVSKKAGDKSGPMLVYRNLWLPGRFPCLIAYGLALAFAAAAFACGKRPGPTSAGSRRGSRRGSEASGKVV